MRYLNCALYNCFSGKTIETKKIVPDHRNRPKVDASSKVFRIKWGQCTENSRNEKRSTKAKFDLCDATYVHACMHVMHALPWRVGPSSRTHRPPFFRCVTTRKTVTLLVSWRWIDYVNKKQWTTTKNEMREALDNWKHEQFVTLQEQVSSADLTAGEYIVPRD